MTKNRSLYAMVAATGVALAALGGAGAAHAHGGVSWSVGIGVPGVVVGASNGYGYPAYAAPAPVYVAPSPVYYTPPPPVVYAPRPVYYAPPPVVVAPSYGYYRHHHHGWRR